MQTVIDINLKKKADFYSTYSSKRLNPELTEYIYNECYGEDYKNKVIINMHFIICSGFENVRRYFCSGFVGSDVSYFRTEPD